MKKDLFKIESDEIKRILSLHEERSKNQYLDILSEQSVVYNKVKAPQFKTTKVHPLGDQGYFPVGTVFKPKDKNNLTTTVLLSQFATANASVTTPPTIGSQYGPSKKQPKKITITYNCRNKNFTLPGSTSSYASTKELEGNLSKNLCGKEPAAGVSKEVLDKKEQESLKTLNAVYLVKKPYTIGSVKLQQNDYVQKGKVSGILNIIRNGQKILSFNCANKKFFLGDKTMEDTAKGMTTTLMKFCPAGGSGFKFKTLYTIAGNYSVGGVDIKANDTVIKSSKYENMVAILRDGAVKMYFNCQTSAFSGNAVESPTNGKTQLTTTLKTKVCPQITPSSNDTKIKDIESPTSGEQQQTQQKTETQTVTKQVQTSLGSKTPTGKITDAELDAILAKLG